MELSQQLENPSLPNDGDILNLTTFQWHLPESTKDYSKIE